MNKRFPVGLKKGCVNRIVTPDLIGSMKRHSNLKDGFSGVYQNEWTKWGHKNILTRQYLEELAKFVGYSKVVFNDKDKSISKLMPVDTRPEDDRKNSECIFCDLIK